MLTEIIKKEIECVNDKSLEESKSLNLRRQQETATILYVGNLVENNYETFLDALTLLQKGQRNPEGVYTKIKSKIEHLNNVAMSNSGQIMRPVTQIYGGDEWVKLGWGEYVGTPGHFNVIMTDKGEEIVNAYRVSQDLSSLEDTLGEGWKTARASYHSLSNIKPKP